MKLVFCDRYEEEIESISIRDKVTDFRCPLQTYSYRLQLINGGVTKFHFHWIMIQEVTHETEEISQ